MTFVCFDVYDARTLKLLIMTTMVKEKKGKKAEDMKQEPKAIVKVQNQIIISYILF